MNKTQLLQDEYDRDWALYHKQSYDVTYDKIMAAQDTFGEFSSKCDLDAAHDKALQFINDVKEFRRATAAYAAYLQAEGYTEFPVEETKE